MDYPAPLVEIKDGRLDFSNAYATGIGAYDRFAISYAYAQFPDLASEDAELDRIVDEGIKAGMLYISDDDARPPGAAHPLANLWDNGPHPVAALRHEMKVRRIGLEQFGLGNIPQGAPLSTLEARLLPLYLHHRYQLHAAVKMVGGVHYTYAVKTGAGTSPAETMRVVPPGEQRESLEAVLSTIEPEALAIPQRALDLVLPNAFGFEAGTAELFAKPSSPFFDPIAAAAIAADLAVSGLLEPHRAARMQHLHARDRANPDFAEVLDALVARTWGARPSGNGYHAAIARAVQGLVATRLMDLAASADAAPQVRASATDALRRLAARIARAPSAGADGAHRRYFRDEIERFLTRPAPTRKPSPPPSTPPGDPIGGRASFPSTSSESP
jgi:hypothetical protein